MEPIDVVVVREKYDGTIVKEKAKLLQFFEKGSAVVLITDGYAKGFFRQVDLSSLRFAGEEEKSVSNID